MLSTLVFAATLKVMVIVLPGEGALTRTEARTLVQESFAFYRQEFPSVRIRIARVKTDPTPIAPSLNNWVQQFNSLRGSFARRWRKSGRPLLFIAPPLDGTYIGGRAERKCGAVHDAVGIAFVAGDTPRRRLLSYITILHEVGHMLSAQHSTGIMSEGALSEIADKGFPLEFSNVSRKEIWNCFKQIRR